MLVLITRLQAIVLTAVVRRRPAEREAGQSTVEYALVLLAAAAVALLVVAWAARTGRIGELFNRVIDSVTAKVS